MNIKNIKVVAMDLDGTLTQHKHPLEKQQKEALDKLAEKYKLLMVGAGQVMRIFRQLGQYPIDIIGNYGLQTGKYNSKNKNIDIIKDLTYPINKPEIEEKAKALRQKYGYTEYTGDSVEYHTSGCLTFALLGTAANSDDKISFDPDRIKRRKIYNDVCERPPKILCKSE